MMNETLGLYLPDCVLDFTEGKRAVIVGAQGNRDVERAQLQKIFGFKEVVWCTSEERQTGPFLKIRSAIEMGKFDAVFHIVSFSGHHIQDIIKPACHKMHIPMIHIPRGYHPNGFSKAIEEQVCRGLQRQEHARSSGQVIASHVRPVNY